jgi:putative hydrolase of the HAD superfamily
MEIKAVLFDLDQTLIDFMKMRVEACRSAIEAMIKVGLKIDKREGLKKLLETYFRLGIESDRTFSKFLDEQTGTIDEKILKAGIDAYLKTKPLFLKPYPYVLETLEFLKNMNLKLGIVTDAPREKAIYRLKAMDIIHFFDVIITFDESKVKKPNELPFLLALEKLGLKSEEILFVGDSIRRDIEPAEKLGMKTLLIKKHGDLKKIEQKLRS